MTEETFATGIIGAVFTDGRGKLWGLIEIDSSDEIAIFFEEGAGIWGGMHFRSGPLRFTPRSGDRVAMFLVQEPQRLVAVSWGYAFKTPDEYTIRDFSRSRLPWGASREKDADLNEHFRSPEMLNEVRREICSAQPPPRKVGVPCTCHITSERIIQLGSGTAQGREFGYAKKYWLDIELTFLVYRAERGDDCDVHRTVPPLRFVIFRDSGNPEWSPVFAERVRFVRINDACKSSYLDDLRNAEDRWYEQSGVSNPDDYDGFYDWE